MHRSTRTTRTIALTIAWICAPPAARAAPGEFVEPEVEVLYTITGKGLFGWAVSELGDIDGDGAMEAMAGAPFDPASGMAAGSARVVSGRDGAPLFSWTGEPGDNLGYALADAGDVDADGLPDVVVGSVGAARVEVFSGADGEPLFTRTDPMPGTSLGSAVASAGDLDGDGHADVLVGAETDATGGMDAGRVEALSGADFMPLWTRTGDTVGGFLGSGTARIGDIDGDGVPDLAVGARGSGPLKTGRVYVLSGVDGSDLRPPHESDANAGNLGHFFVGGPGDIDGDGVPDVYGGDYSDSSNGPASGKAYVWSGATGERLHTFTGTNPGDGLGCGRGAGDIDGDGVPDIATGAYGASPGGVTQAGSVTVWSGATGTVLRTISGTTEMEQVGFDVVGLGDVDADGSDDLLVSGANGNAIYVVAGAPATNDTTGAPDPTSGEATSAPDSTGASIPTTSVDDGGDGSSAGSTTGSANPQTTAPEADPTASGCGCRSAGTPTWLVLTVLALPRRRVRPSR